MNIISFFFYIAGFVLQKKTNLFYNYIVAFVLWAF
jgi:hypothetical protein